ncbi:hypothetical protein hamaS1_27570 [Moorella sp. Hama-1]|nr:hypothetical protein hamaS1_27570 [Moorella sp. Hama-1]
MLNFTSGSPRFPQVTAKTGQAGGYVHSVFHRFVNFYLGPDFFALAGPEKGNAAAFVILDLPENIDFFALGIKPDLPVNLADGWLRVGDALAIDCRWSIPWPGRGPEELRWERGGLAWVNVAALGRAIDRWGVKGGVGDPAGPHNPHSPVAGSLGRLRARLLGRHLCHQATPVEDENGKVRYFQDGYPCRQAAPAVDENGKGRYFQDRIVKQTIKKLETLGFKVNLEAISA